MPITAIKQLDMKAPAVDGEAPLIGPSALLGLTEHDLGPVRLLGWSGANQKPLLHAKLLVLGEIAPVFFDMGEDASFTKLRFLPEAVWCGSANWTEASRSHLEVGFFCDDPSLVREAGDFVADVIAFSEPVGTTCAGPEPNLVWVGFDDEKMAEQGEGDEGRLGYIAYLASLDDDEDEDDLHD